MALPIIASGQGSNDDLSCRVWPISSSFSWITHGEIVLADIRQNNRTIAQNYIYISEDGEKIALTASASAIVKAIRNEIKQNEAVSFVRNSIVDFLIKTYPAQNTYLLNAKYKEEYEEAIWFEDRKVHKIDLSKYCADPVIKINGNQWSAEFVTINQRGIANKWLLTGMLNVFGIEKINIMELASDIPMPLRF